LVGVIDVLTREQLTAIADGLGEVARRLNAPAEQPDAHPGRAGRVALSR
jgi:hypothetical protein